MYVKTPDVADIGSHLFPAMATATRCATQRVSDFTKDLADLVESRCSTVQVFVEDQKVAPRQAG